MNRRVAMTDAEFVKLVSGSGVWTGCWENWFTIGAVTNDLVTLTEAGGNTKNVFSYEGTERLALFKATFSLL